MINIKEASCKKIPGESSLFLTFPYNEELLDIVKKSETAVWHKNEKEWEVPITELKRLIEFFQYIDDISLDLLDKKEASFLKQPILDYKLKPFDYQLEGITYGLNHNKWLLLDGMGLGKTAQALHLAEELKAQEGVEHCLIVCGINALKSNWKQEASKHTNESSIILGERVNTRGKVVYGSIKDRVDHISKPIEEFFIITNIETLRSEDFIKAYKKGPNKIDMIVLDECHKVKNKTTKRRPVQQTEGLLKLDAKYKVAMTGTLIVNDPLDAFVPLTWIDALHCNQTEFKKYFCVMGGLSGYQVVGFKNMSILKEILANHSLRRTKDILDLPPKNIIHEVLDMNDDQVKFYNSVKDGVKEEVNKVELKTTSLLALCTRLRQAATCPSILTTENISSIKTDRAVDLTEQIIENGDKVVIFSNFKEPLNILKERLSEYKPLLGTGDISDTEFSDNINNFQNNKDNKVFLGTISKAGTGITLTAASYVIFLDASWTSAANQQAEDRCYRIGSKSPVFIYYLWANDTLDLHIKDLVEAKAQVSDYIIDNKVSENMNDVLRNMLKEDNYK